MNFVEEMTEGAVAVSRNYTEHNTDLSCRGFDSFQDAVFFHSPVIGQGESFEEGSEAKAKWLAKYNKKRGYFPARALALLQPSRGKVILPLGIPHLEELWKFFQNQLKLDDDQVIWFHHEQGNTFEYDLMRDESAVATLKNIIATSAPGDATRTLFLFSNRPEITPWAEDLGFHVVKDSRSWRDIYGFKDILHPRPGAESSVLQDITINCGVEMPVPRGYVCSNTAELMQAVDLMRTRTRSGGSQDLVTDVLLKPVSGSDGDGIEFYSLSDTKAFEEYRFSMGEILLEEKLNLERYPDGSVMSIVTHYFGDKLLGPSCDQLLGSATSSTAFNGNIFPSAISRPLRKQCEEVAEAIMKVTLPQGPGGFDFLFQDGKPYLVDVNAGRFNGGMYPKAFHKQYASRQSAYVSFKHVPNCSVDEMWEVLKRHNMDFIPILPSDISDANGESDDPRRGTYGVFPLVHLPGNFGSYLAIAQTREEVLQLKDRFLEFRF
mmetsp:Transcript_20980/g.30266  ORF Transcript_20980/g.30266 Transcript_20980/m.30266 type:complete len:491 (-) Transcript_20980:144-1616(-)